MKNHHKKQRFPIKRAIKKVHFPIKLSLNCTGLKNGANKQRILHAIQIDNTLSVLKLQVLTDIPLRTLQREINELIELGALEKGGTRKNIIWTIKNNYTNFM